MSGQGERLVLTERGIDALEAWLDGGPILPEACEAEERREIFDAHRAYGRMVRLAATLQAQAGAAATRLDRWRANLGRYTAWGAAPERARWFRAREARALAWLGWQGVAPAGKGRTRVEIGNVSVLWTDATAAWAIEGKPQVHGVGIVSLWMLARDVSGLTAEAEIEDAISQ